MILANYATGTCTIYNLNFEHCGMMRDRHTVGMSLTVGEVCLSRLTNEGGRERGRGGGGGVCVLGDWAGRVHHQSLPSPLAFAQYARRSTHSPGHSLVISNQSGMFLLAFYSKE